jgi:hypothetical protein
VTNLYGHCFKAIMDNISDTIEIGSLKCYFKFSERFAFYKLCRLALPPLEST